MEKKLIFRDKAVQVMKALLAAYAVTGVLLILLTFLMYKFNMGESKVQIGILAVYILSNFLGGLLLGKQMKVRRFLWGAVLGVLYFLLLFLISMGVYRTTAGAAGSAIALLLCAAGGMLGGMIS